MQLGTILIGHMHKMYCTNMSVCDNFCAWAEHYPVTLVLLWTKYGLEVGEFPGTPSLMPRPFE